MANKIWMPTWRLKDKTPLFGPLTEKPAGKSFEFIIGGRSYWVESTAKEFTTQQKEEVEAWIRKKMKISSDAKTA